MTVCLQTLSSWCSRILALTEQSQPLQGHLFTHDWLQTLSSWCSRILALTEQSQPLQGHHFTHDCLVTDSFQLVFKDSGVNKTVGLLNTGIAWVSDKSVKFGNPSGMCYTYRNIFLAKLQQTQSGCHWILHERLLDVLELFTKILTFRICFALIHRCPREHSLLIMWYARRVLIFQCVHLLGLWNCSRVWKKFSFINK